MTWTSWLLCLEFASTQVWIVQDNANALKTQLDQQKTVVDNLVSNTRVCSQPFLLSGMLIILEHSFFTKKLRKIQCFDCSFYDLRVHIHVFSLDEKKFVLWVPRLSSSGKGWETCDLGHRFETWAMRTKSSIYVRRERGEPIIPEIWGLRLVIRVGPRWISRSNKNWEVWSLICVIFGDIYWKFHLGTNFTKIWVLHFMLKWIGTFIFDCCHLSSGSFWRARYRKQNRRRILWKHVLSQQSQLHAFSSFHVYPE